jgi:signal transduction histidine kinase
MQALVEEGMAYASSAHGTTEPARRTDVDALLESLVCDWTDAGHVVHLSGRLEVPLVTRPHALCRIVTNLVENALKFGGNVQIVVTKGDGDDGAITVLDRGPGIPSEELDRVLLPFYRVEGSRSRATGGTGLGLAIANQLAAGVGGALTLTNREGGGLAARVTLSAVSVD